MEVFQRNEIIRLGRELLESLKTTTINDLNNLYDNGKNFYNSYKRINLYVKNRENFLFASKVLLNKTLKLARGVTETKIEKKINSIYSILIRQGQQLGVLQQDKISPNEVNAHMDTYNNLLELMKLLINNARL